MDDNLAAQAFFEDEEGTTPQDIPAVGQKEAQEPSERVYDYTTITALEWAAIEAYIANGHNGVQAWLAVSPELTYSAAGRRASILFNHPDVKHIIAQREMDIAESCTITTERVLAEYAVSAFVDPAAMFDRQGRLLPIQDMPPHVRRAISEFTVEEDDMGEVVLRVKKVKLNSKQSALDSIARHLGMFNKDQLNLNVNDKLGDRLDRALAALEAHR